MLCWSWDEDFPIIEPTDEDWYDIFDSEDLFRVRLHSAKLMVNCHSPYVSSNPRRNGYHKRWYYLTKQEKINWINYKEYMKDLNQND